MDGHHVEAGFGGILGLCEKLGYAILEALEIAEVGA